MPEHDTELVETSFADLPAVVERLARGVRYDVAVTSDHAADVAGDVKRTLAVIRNCTQAVAVVVIVAVVVLAVAVVW